jgi:hypothetical protein
MTCSESEKEDKQIAHKKIRRSAKVYLDKFEDDEGMPNFDRKFHNPWHFSKDGKQYWAEASPKDMRK